ncbi:MAG: cell division protein ZapB [Candidatus Krumholzibacteriota bacterium]|nr:cell division protein ZapB [Candidatus Krumholzibacteriota bacterium]
MGSVGLASLEVLEEKIIKAAELIERLSGEKKRLEEKNKELKDQVDSLYIKNEELKKEIEIFNSDKDKRKDFDKTREEIGNKIEEMLLKLDGLEL